MRDEETGSYWQQVTGTAIAGPLKGRQLSLVAQDELTFALWKKERPNGTVLAPMPRYAAKYEKASWENEIARAANGNPRHQGNTRRSRDDYRRGH